MSRVVAVEQAANNIRVNVVKPGAIMTPMQVKAWKDHPGAFDRIVRETPQRRFGDSIEVARLVLFLASDESSHITGAKFTIDGGIEADSHII